MSFASPQPPWEESNNCDQPAQSPAHAVGQSLADLMAHLWRHGGWDGRLSPRVAWQRVLGDTPYPDALKLAEHPTLGPLDVYLEDLDVTDIHLNGPGRETVTRRSGDILEFGMRETLHPDWHPWIVQQLRARGYGKATDVQLCGSINMTRPGYRPCLVRYEVVLPPLCFHGPVITLRVLRPGQMSLERLVELECLSADAAEFLARCMRSAVDILIVGIAGAGKTTLANALLATVADQRVIVIEDAVEILIPNERAIHLDLASVGNLTFADMVRAALRMNAQRIVVGETRGKEAYAVLAAARNGYPILTTLHGDSALHGLHNLAAMALEAEETHASLEVVHATLNSRPLIVVSLTRDDHRRQVSEIVELQRQFGSARPTIEPLYARRHGALAALTRPSHALLAQLDRAGGR